MSVRLSVVRPGGEVILNAAMEYARRGLRVVPVHIVRKDRTCGCGNAECDTPGKHPCVPNWQERGTTDRGLMTIWFTGRWQSANIGIVTGAKSGVIVLDEDPRNGGDDSLDAVEYRNGRLPDTLTAMTGGGGNHYYFQHPGWPVPNKVSLRPGLDVKGDDGLAVAPPSVHESGGVYDWDGTEGFETPISPAPDWLLRLIQGSGSGGGTPSGEARANISGAIPQGERNSALAGIGGYLRRFGAPQETILAALLAVNDSQCQPPLTGREVQAISKSVARYAPVVNDLAQMPAEFSDLTLAMAAMPKSVSEIWTAMRMNLPGFEQAWRRSKKMATPGSFPHALAVAGMCRRVGLSHANTASILAQQHREFGEDLSVAEAIRLIARARVNRAAPAKTGMRRGKGGGK